MKNNVKSGCLPVIICGAAAIIAGALIKRRIKKLPIITNGVTILGIPVDAVDMDGALCRIEEYITTGGPHHIFTADASGLIRAAEDEDFAKLVRAADMVTADGAGALLAVEMRGGKLPGKVSGCDLVDKLSGLAAAKGYSVFLFGAADGVATAAAEKLKSLYPTLNIAGIRNGYFKPEEEEEIVRQIIAANPQILYVALGIPKQEQFIRKYFTTLNVPVMIGIGGSFDVISGTLKRAPQWMQKVGLEWLYRLIQEPKRLSRMTALPRFIVAAWKTKDVERVKNEERRVKREE
jgi:N-acetylglucosaminyldiphosphoundecaprenol N-acetyl-beta-D-mannosaminyltransferase